MRDFKDLKEIIKQKLKPLIHANRYIFSQQWVMNFCRWIVQVVLRPEETKGFLLLKKRWVVERTFGWLMGCRRLVRDYELLPETSETLIYLAMIRIMLRRLA